MTADVVPLTPTIHHLAPCVELQGALNTRCIAYLVDQLRAEHQRLVVELVRRLRPIGGQEAVEVTFLGDILEQHQRLRVFRLGQLQAAGLPVAPAVSGCEVLRQFFGQLIRVFPARQAQQQAQAPFGDGVVTQLRVVLGHDGQAPAVVTTGERQADFTGD